MHGKGKWNKQKNVNPCKQYDFENAYDRNNGNGVFTLGSTNFYVEVERNCWFGASQCPVVLKTE
jgi:hypothetical protein